MVIKELKLKPRSDSPKTNSEPHESKPKEKDNLKLNESKRNKICLDLPTDPDVIEKECSNNFQISIACLKSNSPISNRHRESSEESVNSIDEFEMIEKDVMKLNIDAKMTGMSESTCSNYNDTISQIEQPSVMQESLLSLTTTPVLKRKPQIKLGTLVVQKNIATIISTEDLSCSSISNIDNVQPPTMMEDIEISTLSIASIPTDAVEALSISSEAIRDIVHPAGQAVQCFEDSCISLDFDLTNASVSQQLDQICPPTAMDDITLTSHTLVVQPEVAAIFIVDDAGNTIDDITDVFDEESTMTAGIGDDDFDIPELPYDSKNNSPAHSRCDSSTKTTPVTVRKISPERKRDITKCLTYTKFSDMTPAGDDMTPVRDDPETSGYKSLSVEMSLRAINEDETGLSEEEKVLNYLKQMSPRQLFDEDITHIESEANLVAQTINDKKIDIRSRSSSVFSNDDQSRCSSIGILRDRDILRLDFESQPANYENSHGVETVKLKHQSKQMQLPLQSYQSIYNKNHDLKKEIHEIPKQKSESNQLNQISQLTRQNTFTADRSSESNPDKLCNQMQKTFQPRREQTMIPITRNRNPPKIPPKPSMINFVKAKSSTQNYHKSQTLQPTGKISQQNKLKNSISSNTIHNAKSVPHRSPSCSEIGKYKPQQKDGSFCLEANKVKLSNRPIMNTKEKKTLKFSKFWKKSDEPKNSIDILGSKNPSCSRSGSVSEQESEKYKSNFSKKLKNFGFKKGVVTSTSKKTLSQPDQNETPNKFGNSIVLLSPNDTELLGHNQKINKPRTLQRPSESLSNSKQLISPRVSKITSSRDNMTPIISNPRNKFLQPQRGASYVSSTPSRPSNTFTYNKAKKEPGLNSTGSATVTLV